MTEQHENDWSEWQKLVIEKFKTLDEVKEDVKTIMVNDLPHIREEIATLKVKAGIWGAIAGALPALIISAIGILIVLSQLGK
jgi:hypothetical protein